jgi:tRNA pseudouridine13 synthase
MKLRQLPEDFIVEEIAELNLTTDGKYSLYKLQKKGLETFALVAYLAKKYNLPFKSVCIAGLKDKHSISTQYLTIPRDYNINTLKEKNFSLNFLGFVDKQIDIGDLIANKFVITIRDLKEYEMQNALKKAETVEYLPNYFDSQRFGSVIHNEFIARYFLKKNYERSVKIFLTSYTRHEKSQLKNEKRRILENWPNFQNVKIENKRLKLITEEYIKSKDWLKAFNKLPPNLREMFFSAYQSYLWNECLKDILKNKVKNLFSVKYNIGKLYFFDTIDQFSVPNTIQSIQSNMLLDKNTYEIVNKILKKEGLQINDLQQSLFKLYERPTLIKPENIKFESDNDEINPDRFKITLSFTLPKGSYATIVTKAIFGK